MQAFNINIFLMSPEWFICRKSYIFALFIYRNFCEFSWADFFLLNKIIRVIMFIVFYFFTHKTLPRSSVLVNWILVRFYEVESTSLTIQSILEDNKIWEFIRWIIFLIHLTSGRLAMMTESPSASKFWKKLCIQN